VSKMQRDKGKRIELEIVHLFEAWGLRAMRVPLSGATSFSKMDMTLKGDVDVYLPRRDAPLVGEVKARKAGFKQLTSWLGDNDFLVVRPDRGEPMFVLPVETMRELMTR
jgi:Holliday junction resolvase